MFYDSVVRSQGVSKIPASVGACPPPNPAEGTRYTYNNIYSPGDASWAWHAYPYASIPANTWVEVMHEADPFGDEHFGMWFLYAKGSGIYFDTGATKVFNTHADAYAYFNARGPHYNEDMSRLAASRGYDSVQFIAHPDATSYPCAARSNLQYMGIEIVAVRLVGTFACGAPGGAPSTVRAGWQASKTCACNNALKYLNCQGVPEMSLLNSTASKLATIFV